MMRLFVLLALSVLMLTGYGASAAPAQTNDLDTLYQQFKTLYDQGKYAEAETVGERLLKLTEQTLGPDDIVTADALNNIAVVYLAQGRYNEALETHTRALAIAEKALGPDHPTVAEGLNNIANVYWKQGHHDEALKDYSRALAIFEKTPGGEPPNVAMTLNNIANVYHEQGRYTEALKGHTRALAIYEKSLGPTHPDVAATLNNIAILYYERGHYAEALKAYNRALSIRKKGLGPSHPDVGATLNNVGIVYDEQGRYAEALKIYNRALAIYEKALGRDHPNVATTLDNIGTVYFRQGHYPEASKAYTRALAIREKGLGPSHPEVAATLNNVGIVHDKQGRYAEALKAYNRALVIYLKAIGPEHANVAAMLDNIGTVYAEQGHYAEALKAHNRALAIYEKALGPDHPDVAGTLTNIGIIHVEQGQHAKALTAYNRALAVYEKAFGLDHPDVAETLYNIGFVHFEQDHFAEALKAYNRALAIFTKAQGDDHPNLADTLNGVANVHMAQHDWANAADDWHRATAILERRTSLGARNQAIASKVKGEAARSSSYFEGLIKAIWRRASDGNAGHRTTIAAMFLKAQWAQASDAAEALAKMAARSAKGDPALAALVWERQDLVVEWQRRDQRRSAAVAQSPDNRNKDAEAENVARLLVIEARVHEIDKNLELEFPDYAALANPGPATIEVVQKDLRDDEALVLFLDTDSLFKPLPAETFIWVVTKTDVRWVRTDLGSEALQDAVARLRCGLDYEGSWDIANSQCAKLLDTTYSPEDHRSGKPLPFDLSEAHALYRALFGQVEDLIRGKELLIVPSGALTQLPFPVLVTEKADPAIGEPEALRSAAWLIRKHAITVLPSVSSLKALRRLANRSQAGRTLIGFGNPLLTGPSKDYEDAAREAHSKQACPKTLWQQVAGLFGERRGVPPLKLRSGLADVAQIRSQVPLPETADELCAVARDLNVSGSDIHLGSRATETDIKRLSQSGDLAKYRIVHFATHGALAGQVSVDSEPGLLLTPPDEATETDDGYLSASEVAGLKLDADWVVLSACNTAAGGPNDSDALSGLARAFFYAGDRALLVSHWSVYSNATVKLITGAMSRIAADKRTGRAEAMRQSMLAVIDGGKAYEARPAFWAPFVVVGEGAPGSR